MNFVYNRKSIPATALNHPRLQHMTPITFPAKRLDQICEDLKQENNALLLENKQLQEIIDKLKEDELNKQIHSTNVVVSASKDHTLTPIPKPPILKRTLSFIAPSSDDLVEITENKKIKRIKTSPPSPLSPSVFDEPETPKSSRSATQS